MSRTSRIVVTAVTAIAMLRPATAATAASRADGDRIGRPSVFRVRMIDRARNRFRPATLTIHRGDSVRWINAGSLTHTTTGRNWNSGNVPPGDSFRQRFRRPGTFSYHCQIHPEMTGRIIVE